MHAHVKRSSFALRDTMIAIRISHVIKRFPQLDQTIHETFYDFQVCVRLAGAVNYQKISLPKHQTSAQASQTATWEL